MVKPTTVGAPAPQVSKTTVTRSDAPKLLVYNRGAQDIWITFWSGTPICRILGGQAMSTAAGNG